MPLTEFLRDYQEAVEESKEQEAEIKKHIPRAKKPKKPHIRKR